MDSILRSLGDDIIGSLWSNKYSISRNNKTLNKVSIILFVRETGIIPPANVTRYKNDPDAIKKKDYQ